MSKRQLKHMSKSFRRVVVESVPISKDEFIANLIKDKPTEIYNVRYSTEKPLYTDVTCYDIGHIRYRCPALADKSLHTRTYDDFYDEARISGIENLAYYVNPVPERDKSEKE